jgi:ubiquinone/menaquinone biosynthesis C-methylase UbiE
MRAHRPGHLAPAIDAAAGDLPFDERSFDAARAALTVHGWADAAKGLGELRRVARGPVVILSFDGEALDRFRWPTTCPSCAPVAVPIDCLDGFMEAFYARPEGFLDEARPARYD